MAAASSSPELFINVIGTFVTEGDLGVGTIVGSAVFNILAVPACCALLAHEVDAIIIKLNAIFTRSQFSYHVTDAELGMVVDIARYNSLRLHSLSLDLDSAGWTYRVVRGAHSHHVLHSIHFR